jgi:hypothetical protein
VAFDVDDHATSAMGGVTSSASKISSKKSGDIGRYRMTLAAHDN